MNYNIKIILIERLLANSKTGLCDSNTRNNKRNKMDRFNKILLNAVVLTGILFCSVIFAQEKTTNDGVFTEAQVVAGEPVYTSSCGTCHDLKFYDFTFRSWMGKPLLDFWYHILAEMPSDNPGSFYDDEYTTVIAYILSELGYPSGDVALDPENGMDLIKFAPL